MRTALLAGVRRLSLATADRVIHLPRSGETHSGTHLELRETSASYRSAVDR